MPELRDHVNEVKAINLVVAPDKTVVTLLNSDKGWTVQDKGGYLADIGKLRQFLLSLADAKLLEAKTSHEQRYAELAVEDIKNSAAKSILVRIEGLSKPTGLLVGNVSKQGDGSFVRRADDKQSWLASGQITVDKDAAHWLDTNLLDFGAEQIAEVVLTKPGSSALRLFKQQVSDSNFQVADIPAGRTLLAADVLNNLATTLAGLSFEDVAPNQSVSVPEEKQLLKAHFRDFDGVIIAIDAWLQDNKHYARFAANLDQAIAEAAIQSEIAKAKADQEAKQNQAATQAEKPAAQSTPPAVQLPLAATDPEKFRQQRLDELKEEVERLNQRLQAWTFVLPAYKYANMDKSINDVLQPLAEAKPSIAPH